VGRGSLWSSSCLRDSGVVTSVGATVLFLSLVAREEPTQMKASNFLD